MDTRPLRAPLLCIPSPNISSPTFTNCPLNRKYCLLIAGYKCWYINFPLILFSGWKQLFDTTVVVHSYFFKLTSIVMIKVWQMNVFSHGLFYNALLSATLHKMFTLCNNNSVVCCIHCLCLSFIWNLVEILTLWKSWLGSILEEKRTKKEIQLRALIKPYLKLDTWTGSIKRGQTFIHSYSWDVFMMPEVCDHVAYSECEEPLLYYGENV